MDVLAVVGLSLAGVVVGLFVGVFLATTLKHQANNTAIYGPAVDEAAGAVIDKQYREEVQEVARVKIEKGVERDVEKFGKSLEALTQQVGGHIQEEVQKQVVPSLQDMQKVVSDMQASLIAEAKKLSDDASAHSRQMATEYDKIIKESRESAADAIAKSVAGVEQEIQGLVSQTRDELAAYKQRMTEQLTNNMAEVVGYYIRQSLGDKLDIESQMDGIVASLEEKKSELIEDMNR